MAFQICEGSSDDLPEIVEIHQAAFADDDLWGRFVKNVKSEDERAFQLAYLTSRSPSSRDKLSFLLKETATGKIVGYTFLGHPQTLTPEEKAVVASIPTLPEGSNTELINEMIPMISLSKKYGFDQEKHWHRRGIAVLPAYQRRGLASMLSRHCNEIVDRAGGKTFVLARPLSKLVFEKEGFKVLGGMHVDVTKYGGTAEEGECFIMLREAGGCIASENEDA